MAPALVAASQKYFVGNKAQSPIQGCRGSAMIPAGVPMKNMSAVVQHLRRERERVHKHLQRIDEALAALGGNSSSGTSRTMSAAGRRAISLAQNCLQQPWKRWSQWQGIKLWSRSEKTLLDY